MRSHDNLLRGLHGGDRRSIRGVPEVVRRVLADPVLFPVVFNGMTNADYLVRMRSADAVEKITALHPEYLTPYKQRILELAAAAREQEVRWHLAQLLSRLQLTAAERRRVLKILIGYLADPSRIVKTCAMQGLADLAVQDSRMRAPIIQRLRGLTRRGSPAMKSRGRKLLDRLSSL